MKTITEYIPIITKDIRNYVRLAEKSLPTIFAGSALVCLGGAVIMTAKGMHEADLIIFEEKKRREETLPEYNNKELTLKEKVELTWKEFIPAAAFTASAAVLTIASERKGTERYLAALSAYELGKQAIEERKDAEIDILGPEKASEIDTRVRENMAKSVVQGDGIQWVEGPGEKTLFVEPFTNTPFWATYDDVLHAFNVVNHTKQSMGVASINDFLKALGLRQELVADSWGWNEDDALVEPDLDRSELVDDEPTRPATIVGYSVEPRPDYGNDRRQY